MQVLDDRKRGNSLSMHVRRRKGVEQKLTRGREGVNLFKYVHKNVPFARML